MSYNDRSVSSSTIFNAVLEILPLFSPALAPYKKARLLRNVFINSFTGSGSLKKGPAPGSCFYIFLLPAPYKKVQLRLSNTDQMCGTIYIRFIIFIEYLDLKVK